MIVQETITRPATVSTVDKTVCDECGAHAYTKCTECHADLCRTHRIVSPEDSHGDYTNFVCADCFEIMRVYTTQIAEAESALEDIYNDRRTACTIRRKKKNEANKTKLPDTNKA
jgi:hypothetical protein